MRTMRYDDEHSMGRESIWVFRILGKVTLLVYHQQYIIIIFARLHGGIMHAAQLQVLPGLSFEDPLLKKGFSRSSLAGCFRSFVMRCLGET